MSHGGRGEAKRLQRLQQGLTFTPQMARLIQSCKLESESSVRCRTQGSKAAPVAGCAWTVSAAPALLPLDGPFIRSRL